MCAFILSRGSERACVKRRKAWWERSLSNHVTERWHEQASTLSHPIHPCSSQSSFLCEPRPMHWPRSRAKRNRIDNIGATYALARSAGRPRQDQAQRELHMCERERSGVPEVATDRMDQEVRARRTNRIFGDGTQKQRQRIQVLWWCPTPSCLPPSHTCDPSPT